MSAGLQRIGATLVSSNRAEVRYEGRTKPSNAVQQMHCMAKNKLPAHYTLTDDTVRDCIKVVKRCLTLTASL